MHAQQEKEAIERRNRLHGDFPSTLKSEACLPATITQRMVGGIGQLYELHARLNEILDRIQGPRETGPAPEVCFEPGLQGEVDKFRHLAGQLNAVANEILIHL
ncbi:MAG: hypothetical protein HY348_09050 [Nitrospira defluvii]|nr:hypothetical protein [Nitrospira defluvii]